MSDCYVTVTGNLTREPQRKFGKKTGIPFTVFGLAQNHTRREANGEFVEAGTSYYDVIAFRAIGENCAAALHTGDPVVVHGRLSLHNWETEERQGTTAQIDAGHVGHDLLFGASSFARGRSTPTNGDRVATEVNGVPGQVNSDGEFFEKDQQGEPVPDEPVPDEPEHDPQVA